MSGDRDRGMHGHMEAAGEALAGGLSNIWKVVAQPAVAPSKTAPPKDMQAIMQAGDYSLASGWYNRNMWYAAAPPAFALSKSAPPKVAYHPNVRCLRGGGGGDPVIVGRMYRVGEGYVSEEKATEEEKAKGPVAPAKFYHGDPVEGFDLRGWAAADIQALRGADGRLALRGAILCRVKLSREQLQRADLYGAQLQGANLCEAELQLAELTYAQLQGATLRMAQLQGANLFEAQLQGARLGEAQLQGADLEKAQLQGIELIEAQLQGADLRRAQLQGADLRRAQLQGADLTGADLSVLPKGLLLPKWGAPGETYAPKDDWPTNLKGANLSVLPKGREYCEGYARVKVSDAARPTNLTDAKAGGADFSEADLSGATFTATTLKDATLKGAMSPPFRPPERPASGALSGAWRIKSLLGSVGRTVVAAADDDDDDGDDSDGENAEEEEAPDDGFRATMKKAVEDCMEKLANEAQIFMCAVDKLLISKEVEEHHKANLLTGALEDRLCRRLKETDVNQAAINDILATGVISPHLDFIQETLLQPSNEAAGTAGQQLLLNAFKENLLGAGKAAILKRLSPIVSKCVRASRARVVPAGKSALMKRLSRGRAVDEEQALLMQPEESAKCLVRELWPALLSSLKAQARHSPAHM